MDRSWNGQHWQPHTRRHGLTHGLHLASADHLLRTTPAQKRKETVQKDLFLWKGFNAQVDDATLLGFEI